MTDQEKKPENTPAKEKTLAEKFLEEKKQAQENPFAAVSGQFGARNPMFNRPGFGGKSGGGGKPTIRKHAARSR